MVRYVTYSERQTTDVFQVLGGNDTLKWRNRGPLLKKHGICQQVHERRAVLGDDARCLPFSFPHSHVLPLPSMGKQFFVGERRDLLISFLDQHKAHKEGGTIDKFWQIIIPAYIAKFPEDNVAIEPRTCLPSKTKCGRISKKRAPGQPKPLREVCPFVNVLNVTV